MRDGAEFLTDRLHMSDGYYRRERTASGRRFNDAVDKVGHALSLGWAKIRGAGDVRINEMRDNVRDLARDKSEWRARYQADGRIYRREVLAWERTNGKDILLAPTRVRDLLLGDAAPSLRTVRSEALSRTAGPMLRTNGGADRASVSASQQGPWEVSRDMREAPQVAKVKSGLRL